MKYCFLILLLFRFSFGEYATIQPLDPSQVSCDPTAISIQINADDVSEAAIGYKRTIGAHLIKDYSGVNSAIASNCHLQSTTSDPQNPPYKIELDITTSAGQACMSDLSFSDDFFGATFLVYIMSYATQGILYNQDPSVVFQVNCEFNEDYNSTGFVKPSKGLQNVEVDSQSGQFEINSTIDGRDDFGSELESNLVDTRSIEFNLENVPNTYILKAKNFWLSPSSDIDDSGAKVYIVKNWQQQSTDALGEQLTLSETNQQVKGGFKTFFWTDPNSNLIYGHAEVCVCDTASSNCNLIQDVCGSSKRSKRSFDGNKLAIYSSKPVKVINKEQQPYNDEETIENETVAVMGAVFSMPTVTLLITSIILKATKKTAVVNNI